MSKHTFYEPQVGETQQMEMRGFQITIGGTYVLLDDVVTMLRAYAQAHGELAVDEAATWLVSGDRPDFPPPEQETEATQPFTLQDFQSDHRVDRVEIYPDDPESLRPKWIARAVDNTGKILHVTNGSFDQAYVMVDAQRRWGVQIHVVADYSHDTIWEENDPGGLRSSHTKRRRPSPNRLWP